MDGIKVKTKEVTDPDDNGHTYYSKDGKIVKRNPFKPIKENEEMMALVSKIAGYQRSEQQKMLLHEFYALVNFLNKQHA
jgi:hypothetical protein